MKPNTASSSSFAPSYERDHAVQTRSGFTVLTAEHKHKNWALQTRVSGILPIDDDQKVSDCDLLYRFLIGRQFSVERAAASLLKYASLRKEYRLNDIMTETYETDVESTATLLYGFDNDSFPIMWNTPDVSAIITVLKNGSKKDLLRVQMRIMEFARFLAKTRHVDRCTFVLDLLNVNMSAVNSLTLSFVRELSKILQEYYPEIMSRILVFNAGWAVTGAWKVLKPFVDARVQEKIRFFCTGPTLELLLPFMPADQILPSYGGTGTRDEAKEIINKELERRTRGPLGTPYHCDPSSSSSYHVDPAALDGSYRSEPTVTLSGEEMPQQQEWERLDDSKESLPPPDGDIEELFSLCSSFDTSDTSDNDSKTFSPTLQIGSPEVLEPSSRRAGDEHSPSTRRRVHIAAGQDGQAINLTECPDGKVMGFCESVPLAEMVQNIVYRGLTDIMRDVLLPRSTSSAVGQERTMVGELLREGGHHVHHHVIVCDAQRRADFVLRKSRLRRRVQVYRVVGSCQVHTDSLNRHSVDGEKVKIGECVPHSGATNDPAAWMMYAVCTSGGGSNIYNRNANEKEDNNGLRLAEKKGQTLIAYGQIAEMAPIDIFTLLMGVCRVWEANLRPPQEGKLMKTKNLFGVRVPVPTTQLLRGLRRRISPATTTGDGEKVEPL
ncbi:Sec14 cytosolic factor [Trypanosoma grayi]|uniref:Sec14 cytosolic factor n=1 Tax=Trypanosoma grayi TaxID=71804 RepID=UPI0004F44D07|nr:Sec14 cytosolic factor [Trypanosoma grayi]KEG10111.1 Sec14 cytosolic factor [Trypanosoma grayi]